MLVLGGSWVVISALISTETIVITHVKGLITLLITTHEPPSRVNCYESKQIIRQPKQPKTQHRIFKAACFHRTATNLNPNADFRKSHK